MRLFFRNLARYWFKYFFIKIWTATDFEDLWADSLDNFLSINHFEFLTLKQISTIYKRLLSGLMTNDIG